MSWDTNFVEFVGQLTAARDAGKDINLDDVMYGLEYRVGAQSPGGDWRPTMERILDHWRKRKVAELRLEKLIEKTNARSRKRAPLAASA